MKKIALMTLATVALSQQNVCAWGRLGHETVIKIAERHLTEKAKANIAEYMPYDLKTDAVWMDVHRWDEEYAYTGRWHGCHVDPATCRYDMDKSAANDDIVRGMEVVEHNLRNYRNLTDSAVNMNLKLILHMVADMHCPVHNHYGRRESWVCTLNGEPYKKFHTVYDRMPALVHGDIAPEELAAKLDTCGKSEIKKIQRGSCEDWIFDCASQCRVIYDWNPYDAAVLNPRTVELSADLVDMQLRNAGYRLAYLLNLYFGK